MQGDFSRDTFDRFRHFSRVLRQQGRVELDADANEQTGILLHFLRRLAADLIGPHGTPADPSGHGGFKIGLSMDGKDLTVARGGYYVDGILCENERDTTYFGQPDWPRDPDEKLLPPLCLVYLDVWERHLTWVEDGRIREVALGGPDTATRAKVVWQVEVIKWDGKTDAFNTFWDTQTKVWQPENRGLLKAQVAKPKDMPSDPCLTPPQSRYRGAENQLYRVEVHRGSPKDKGDRAAKFPTFKWSRDNGSVVFPIRTLEGHTATLDYLGRDDRHTLQVGDWVEVVTDISVLRGEPIRLFKVSEVRRENMTVDLEDKNGAAPPSIDEPDPGHPIHPLLRRWDYKERTTTKGGLPLAEDGALPLQEGKWLGLEDGVQIYFEQGATYRSGDYWLIPARTVTGDVEWPCDENGDPLAEGPNGVDHHYAPLATVDATSVVKNRRRILQQLPFIT